MRYFGFDRTLGQGNVLGFGDIAVEPIVPISTDYIHRYDLNGNKVGYSSAGLSGLVTAGTTFGAGRSVSTASLNLAGAGSDVLLSLPVNSDITLFSLWLKSEQKLDSVLVAVSKEYADYESMVVSFPDLTPVAVGAASNAWQHLLVEIDNTVAGSVSKKLFINNVLASSVTENMAEPFSAIGATLYVGQHNITDVPFIGYIQDIRVYNRRLTSGERQSLFLEQLPM